MNLTDFINTKIKIGYSEYDYFELEKTNPTEYEKLSGLELQYLENGYMIYKEKNMDSESKIHTYIFCGNDLSILITKHCDTKEKEYQFYKDNQISKTVWYMLETKTSLTEYDKYGREILRVKFPQSHSEKLSGYKWINTNKNKLSVIEKLELEKNIKLEKIELTLVELEKYL